MTPRNIRILFIEPKPPRPHVYSRARLPRLGTVILATILRDAGYDASVCIEELEEIDWKAALECDVIGISTITSTAPRAYDLADKFRAAGKTVIMGGAHPSFQAEEALAHCDYVLRGEAEGAIVPLIEALAASRAPGRIPGLSHRDRSGAFVHHANAPLLCDLDSIPIPDFTLVHGQKTRKKVVSISTSRGCPYGCNFCSVIQMFGRQYRYHSVDRVLAEVRRNAPDTGHIFFCDDNFTADMKRTKAILRRIRDERLKIEYSAQVRVEAARDDELLALMAETGCYGVYVGFESINERTLRAYNKHQDLAKITRCIARFRDHGIHVHGMFVFGSDEDEVETIHETTRYCRESGVDSVQYMVLTPFAGTPTYTALENAGRIFNRDWSYYDGAHVVFEPKKMTAYELETESLKALGKFYGWTDALRYAARGDLSYGLIRLYAKSLVGTGKKIAAPYAAELKVRATRGIETAPEASAARRKLRSAAVYLDWLDGRSQSVLLQFLRNLGVKPTAARLAPEPEPEAHNVVGDAAASLQHLGERVDCVLLPFSTSLRHSMEELAHKRDAAREWLKAKWHPEALVCLAPELDEDELYKSCVQIGLALDRKISRIRRAYHEAMASLGSPEEKAFATPPPLAGP